MKKYLFTYGIITGFLASSGLLTGCNAGGIPSVTKIGSIAEAAPQPENRTPAENSTVDPAPAPTTAPETFSQRALIFDGSGTAGVDTESIEKILKSRSIQYDLAGSSDLEAMSLDELATYGVIIWPGGNSRIMTQGLSTEARTKVKQAVTERGVSYVGFCAGAFIVGNSHPVVDGTDWGLGILSEELPYYALYEEVGENTPLMVKTKIADGTERDLLWYGGPSVPEFPNGVIARYPDGSPAIAETLVGKGTLIISGPHPESPDAWIGGAGLKDSDGPDTELAWSLIQAALQRTPLPHF